MSTYLDRYLSGYDVTMSQPPQSDHMDDVDRHEWGPTEPDEMAVLGKWYGYNAVTGTFGFLIGDPRD